MAHSNDPVVIDGVEYRPKWKWSPEYRAHVQARVRADSRTAPHVVDAEYLEWLADQRGITVEQARKAAAG